MVSYLRIKRYWKSWLRRMVISRCQNSLGHWKRPLALPCTRLPSGDFCASSGTHIKKLLVATERLRAHVKERRKNWFRHHLPAMQAHTDRLVFIDETSVKTNLTRQYGRSLCGKRLEMDAPFGAWGTQTFIAGLKHDNLIAPWVIKGAMDGEAFEAYVRNVLVPELQPGTVVICDNLATHYNNRAPNPIYKG